MKRLIILCFASIMATASFAQSVSDVYKQRKAIREMTQQQLKEKVSSDAKDEAKALAADGWKVSPGALPLARQLDKCYNLQYEYDEDLFPMYIIGEGKSVGSTYNAAKMQSMQLAKIQIADQIASEITAIVENTIANNQISPEEAESVTKSVMANKNLISQSIGRVVPIMECYRTLPNKNSEVLVKIAYSEKMCKAAAKEAIQSSLEQEGKELQEKLNEIIGW